MNKIRSLIRRLLLSHATAEEIAQGFALGFFIAMIPTTIGFHTSMALGLCLLMRKNKIATLIGVWMVNPLTMIPLYYLAFLIGKFVLQYHNLVWNLQNLEQLKHLGAKFLIALTVGGSLVGLAGGALFYGIIRTFYPLLKNKMRS